MAHGATFKAYLTKYALTSGIRFVEAKECFDLNGMPYSPRMITYKRPGSMYSEYSIGEEWHLTPEAALAKSEVMRTKTHTKTHTDDALHFWPFT